MQNSFVGLKPIESALILLIIMRIVKYFSNK
jgi:hypothetical protein